jgi:gamma-glutamyltranspeptidase / glutathione hydrolase
MKLKFSIWASALMLAALVGCAGPGGVSDIAQVGPEATSRYTEKPGWAASRFAVAAANPLATQAGYEVLKAGGSAVDAAIAVQMVLGLVEPQSSGLGGGAFLLHYDGHQVEAFDGRETAPMKAGPNLFLGADGQSMAFGQAAVGGRAVGVPGALRMLEAVHRQYGRLPWANLFAPAIALSENGFKVSDRLHALLKADPYLRRDPQALAYFYRVDGSPHEVGHLLRNPALAQVLQKIATQGANALYVGEVAQAMVDKVRQHQANPGLLSLSDLSDYEPKKRLPICHAYTANAGDFRICGFPPPSSGAITVGQILGILASTPARSLALQGGIPSAAWLHLYTEASRLAFADRNLYIGDPDFVDPPAGTWMSLLDPQYLAARSLLIAQGPGAKSMRQAQPGKPPGAKISHAPMPDQTEYGTSHISIVDAFGSALAMTTTIESAFGARQMVHGFLLNNELTDFSFAPADANGVPVANRVQPGKRPLSSMSPTLVFDQKSGQMVMTLGGAGGPFIIRQASMMVFAPLNWGMTVQEAANLPNFSSLNGPTLLERSRFPPQTISALRAMGHAVMELDLPSGIQAIQRKGAGWLGGADPRREGNVMGD